MVEPIAAHRQIIQISLHSGHLAVGLCIIFLILKIDESRTINCIIISYYMYNICILYTLYIAVDNKGKLQTIFIRLY